MKAALFEELGLPTKVIKVTEIPTPEPAPGEVRIKTTKANIIPADIMFIQGLYGLRPKLPQIGGFEATGTIDACGEGVDMAIGTPVIYTAMGAWCEYACVPSQQSCQTMWPARLLSIRSPPMACSWKQT